MDGGQRQHLVWRLKLDLERLPVGVERRVRVAIDQPRHHHLVAVIQHQTVVEGRAELLGPTHRHDSAAFDGNDRVAKRRAAVAVDQEVCPEVQAAGRRRCTSAGHGAIILRHRI